jgi:hypothetical protein
VNEQLIYEKALKLWGADSQVKMLYEEMAELQKALCKYDRNNTPENLINIHEEIADVEIMLCQMRVLFGNSGPDLIKVKKLKRLEALIKQSLDNKI